MISLIYFDTNFFYNLIEEKIEDDEQIELAKFITENKIKFYYTPITFTEITSHINGEEKGKFEYYRNTLIMIKNLCGSSILENPDYILATILKVPPPKRKNNESPSELNKVRDLICKAKDYEELIEGQHLYWDGRLSIVKYQEDVVKNFRADYEAGWITDMYKFIVNAVNPRYFKRLKGGKTPRVTDMNLRQQLLDFLDSIEFKRAFVDASFCKAMNLPQKTLIGQLSEQNVNEIINSLSAYFTAYKTIIRKIVEEGYNVEKNKNDFNDLHFLIYLGLGNHVQFISYDNRLKEKTKGSNQEKRILKIPDLIRE